ncbi:hypothetical protein FGO68_gene9307 [Halteria grandinella]|uniref:TRP C-terminal domain-containing protein n=1 Tax=Halteria grandinella TaxID=5974 RepID=A0A8J8P8E1_HALGN|nr:hypothetical protein FGO68_gene9307 [Halteria grandinella]
MVIGGFTKDQSIISTNEQNSKTEPIVLYIQKGGFFRWAINLYTSIADFDLVTVVKFSPDYKYILAFINDEEQIMPLHMAVLKSVDASLVRSFKDPSGKRAQVNSDSIMFEQQNNQLVIAAQYGTQKSQWMVTRFNYNPSVTGTPASISSIFSYITQYQDTNMIAGALTVVMNPSGNSVLIGGHIRTNLGEKYETLSKLHLTSNALSYHYGLKSSKGTISHMNLHSNIIWFCGQNSYQDMTVSNIALNTGSGIIDTPGNRITYNQQQECMAIKAIDGTRAYVVSAIYDKAILNRVQIGPSTNKSESYSLSGKFTNRRMSAIFKSGTNEVYIMGMTKRFTISATASQSFQQYIGFIVGLDSSNSGSQHFTCSGTQNFFTIAFSDQSGITASTFTLSDITSQVTTTSSTSYLSTISYFSLMSIPTDNIPQACQINTPFTFEPTPITIAPKNVQIVTTLTDISYSITNGNPGSDFALHNICDDTQFYMTAKLDSTTASIPMYWTFDQSTSTLYWASATNYNAGTYNFLITAFIGTGLNIAKLFQVTIIPNCNQATINPSSLPGQQYSANSSSTSMTISWPKFSTSVPNCGSFQYSVVDTSTSSLPPFIILSGSSLTISYDLSQIPSNSINLRVTGWVGVYTTPSNSFTFSISFVADCSSVSISTPQTYILECFVNSICTFNLQEFTLSVGGCDNEVLYTPLDASSLTFVTFLGVHAAGQSPQITIASLDNQEQGSYQFTLEANLPSYTGVSSQRMTVSIKIYPDCSIVPITTQPIQSLGYDIDEKRASVLIAQNFTWEAQYSFCTNQLTYTFLDKDTKQYPDPLVFTFASDASKLTLHTIDPAKARTYNLVVRGGIGSNTADVEFTIQVTNKCLTAKITPVPIPDQDYSIGSPEQIVTYDEWAVSAAPLCGEVTYSVTALDESQLNSNIFDFDQNARSLTIQTNDVSLAQSISIKIKGKLLAYGISNVVIFKVNLIDPCSQVTIISSKPEDLTYEMGKGKVIIKFDEWIESLGTCGNFKYEASYTPQTTVPLYKFDPPSRQFNFDISAGFDEDKEYLIKLKGAIYTGIYKEISFSLFLKVAQATEAKSKTEEVTEKKKIAQMEPLLTARITKINTFGVVNIMFSKSLQQIDDLSRYKEKQTMTLVVEPGGANSLPYILTNWTAISHSGSILKLKISFPNPFEISLTTNFDTLKISFTIPTFFQSADEKSILKKGYFTTGKIPPQNFESTSAVSLEKAQQSMNNLLVSSLGANLALCIVCGISMNNLLQLMNILQIITMIPLMRVSTPPQFVSFCQIVQDFANVNVLPETYSLKGIKAAITGTPISNPRSAGRRLESNDTSQTSELSSNFQMMGIQTASIIDNLGNTVQVIFLLSLAVIVLIIVQKFLNHKPIVMKIHGFVCQLIYWSSFIQSTIQGYLNAQISILVAFKNFSQNTPFEQVLTILIAYYMYLFPILVFQYLIRYQGKLNTKHYKEKYGSLYDNVDPQKNSLAPLASVIFLVRRMILAATLVFYEDYPSFQLIVWVCVSFLMLVYHTIARPYRDSVYGFFEIFNDASVLLISYVMTQVAQYETSEMRDTLGTLLITLVMITMVLNLVNFIINFGINVYSLSRIVYYKLKKYIISYIKSNKKDQVVSLKPETDKSKTVSHTRDMDTTINEPDYKMIKQQQSLLNEEAEQQMEPLPFNYQHSLQQKVALHQIEQSAQKYNHVLKFQQPAPDTLFIQPIHQISLEVQPEEGATFHIKEMRY